MSFQLLMCLDDLNVTAPEQFGTQQSAELLRQLIDGGGLYDLKNHSWKVSTCTSHPIIQLCIILLLIIVMWKCLYIGCQ